jgi:chromosome segregation ATPase
MNDGLVALREEMRQGFAEMRAEMRAGFTHMQREFATLHQGMAELARRLEALERRVDALERRVDRLERRVRENGVMIEALRGQIQQLAEAHVLLDQRVERYRRENEVAHQEILTVLRVSYQDLDRRVSGLEARLGESGPAV